MDIGERIGVNVVILMFIVDSVLCRVLLSDGDVMPEVFLSE